MTIKTVHDAFAFITVVVPWASAAVFLAVVGLLFRREQECAVAAETGRAELQAIGSLLESDNSKTGLISLKVLNARSSCLARGLRYSSRWECENASGL